MFGAEMSTVNYAEVVSKLVEHGRYDEETQADLASLPVQLVPLDPETGRLAGLMRAQTREAGLSLGDRCCLALAKTKGVAAVTTDRAWAELDLEITIELVR